MLQYFLKLSPADFLTKVLSLKAPLSFNNKAKNCTLNSKIIQIFCFQDCQTLILEEHSFRNLRSPLVAIIEDCNRVVMKSSIFSWLLDLDIKNVPNLSVVENTFSVEVKKEPELTATTVSII